MTLRCGLISAILVAVAESATAQIPTLQVFTDTSMKEGFYRCGEYGTTAEVLVVLSNVNFMVAGVDFHIDYPPSVIWLMDFPPNADYIDHEWVTIGNSPTGIAIAWANCCMMDGSQGPFVVMRAWIAWYGSCDNCAPFVVGGYGPLGKTRPTVVRNGDFREFDVIGLWTGYNPDFCDMAVESTTWGKVKSLYR